MAGPALSDLASGLATGLASGVSDLASGVSDRASGLSDRASGVSDLASDMAGELAGQVRGLVGTVDLDPAVVRAQAGLWSTVKVLGSALAALPVFLARVVRAVSAAADVLADRGHELTERGREVAASVPPSRRMVRRTRLRSFGLVAAGLAAGMAIGFVLGRRGERARADDLAAHLEFDPVPAPLSGPDPQPEAEAGDPVTGGLAATVPPADGDGPGDPP